MVSDARSMAKDVHNIIVKVVMEKGQMTQSQALNYVKKMEQQKRYSADVWSWFVKLTDFAFYQCTMLNNFLKNSSFFKKNINNKNRRDVGFLSVLVIYVFVLLWKMYKKYYNVSVLKQF